MPITHLVRSLTAQTAAKAAKPAFHLGGQEGVVEDDRTAEDCKKEVFAKVSLFQSTKQKGGESSSGYYEVLRAIFLIIIILHLLLVFLPYAAIKTRFDSNGTI